MNKTEFIDFISENQEGEATKKVIKEAVDIFLDGIEKALIEGNTVQFVGFGTFGVDARSGRDAKNFHTGDTIKVAPKVYPKLSFGKPLKDAVAEGNKKKVKAMLSAKEAKKAPKETKAPAKKTAKKK